MGDEGAAHTHPEHLPQVGVPEPEGDVGDVQPLGLLLLCGVGGVEWLAVRLGRLVCLLRAEDLGCELPLSAPTPQGGEGLEAGSPNPLGVPILALGRTAFPARRLGLRAPAVRPLRGLRRPPTRDKASGAGVSPLPSPGSALSAGL